MKAPMWSLAAIAGSAALSANTPAQAQELVISMWGGGYAEEIEKTIVQPFEEMTGANVTLDTGLSGERMAKLLATKGRGTDLVYFTDYQMAELAKAGVVQPIDAGSLSNLEGVADFAKDPLGGGMCPAFTVLAVGLAYNGETLAEPPTSWADIFNADLGVSGFPDITTSYTPLLLMKLAEMEGGSADDLTPAFEKVAAEKSHLQFYSSREILDSINQGDVAMAPQLNIFVPKDESVPLRFTYPEEGGLGVLNLVCVTAGSENKELAQQFIDFHLSREIQEAMLLGQGETTVRTDVDAPAETMHSLIPAEELSKLQFFDPNTIVEHRNEWVDQWQERVIAQ